MGPLHPITVHLPIGLLVGHLILTLLFLRRADRSMEIAAYHCLWLGWVLMLPAILTGTYDAVRQLTNPANPRDDALVWINAHAAAGLGVAIVYWQLWQRRRRNPAILDDPRTRGGYLALMGIGVALLLLVGWLGGYLVYQLGLGVR